MMDTLSSLMALKFNEKEIEYQGIKFIVREMNASDKSKYETGLYSYKQIGKDLKVTPNLDDAKAKLVIFTLHDAEGIKIFKGLEDLPLINNLPSSFVEAIADVAGDLSGLNQEQITKN